MLLKRLKIILRRKQKLSEAKKTEVISVGREVVVGSGDNMMYSIVEKIVGDTIFVYMPGKRNLTKININDVRVDLQRGLIKAKLK